MPVPSRTELQRVVFARARELRATLGGGAAAQRDDQLHNLRLLERGHAGRFARDVLEKLERLDDHGEPAVVPQTDEDRGAAVLVELRGGVPVGAWLGLPPLSTFVICVLGNMLPIAPTILALRSPFIKKLAAPLLKRAEKKLAALPTGQSRTLALALFVGIPAPGTGAWTGAIIAYILGMPLATAMGAIFAGVALAGIIMTILTLAGKVGALVALGVLVAGGVGAIMSAKD